MEKAKRAMKGREEKIRSWVETCRERMREPGRYFPPGYEYTGEVKAAGFLLKIGTIMSLQFFVGLHRERGRIEYYRAVDTAGVWPESMAKSFLELTWVHFAYYALVLLFFLGMAVCHYFYYYRDTKSIYLMRRLPRRGAFWKSCAMGPLMGAALEAVYVVLLYLLYYVIYLLVLPADRFPHFL